MCQTLKGRKIIGSFKENVQERASLPLKVYKSVSS